MKILVADDSRVMRQIIIRTLRQAGYDGHDIVEAANGRDAVAKAEAERPDLVLCDWHMPEMTGMQCLRALRSAGSTVPIGFITSDASRELREAARTAGALFLIGKPFSDETLRDALDGVLDSDVAVPGTRGVTLTVEGFPRRDTATLVPAAKDLRDLFAGLLGRAVTVTPGRRVLPSTERPVSLAVYVDAHGSVTAVCLLDLPLCAYLAGALALLPAGGVEDTIEEGRLGPVLEESLEEVVNVLRSAVNVAGAPRSTLDRLYRPGAVIPDDLLVAASGFDRLDLVVDVPGYGWGAMSLVRAG